MVAEEYQVKIPVIYNQKRKKISGMDGEQFLETISGKYNSFEEFMENEIHLSIERGYSRNENGKSEKIHWDFLEGGFYTKSGKLDHIGYLQQRDKAIKKVVGGLVKNMVEDGDRYKSINIQPGTEENNFESWGKIASNYSVDANQVETSYVGGIDIPELKGYQDEINKIVAEVKDELGITGIHPLKIDETKGQNYRREVLGKTIKENPRWKNSASNLIHCLDKNLTTEDVEQILQLVYNPDWNASVIKFSNEFHDASQLDVRLGISHSYFDQSALNKQNDFELLSVGGIIKTREGEIPFGIRTPPKAGNVVHLTPVGSAEPLGKNPLFESFYMELFGELGLTPEDFNSIKLIGRDVDFTLEKQPRSYFTFVGETDLNFEQIGEKWNQAKDRDEHLELISGPEETAKLISFLQEKEYNLEAAINAQKENGRHIFNTLPENHGKFLPPATLSTLHYLVWKSQKSGNPLSLEELEEKFQNHYDLTSCFKK